MREKGNHHRPAYEQRHRYADTFFFSAPPSTTHSRTPADDSAQTDLEQPAFLPPASRPWSLTAFLPPSAPDQLPLQHLGGAQVHLFTCNVLLARARPAVVRRSCHAVRVGWTPAPLAAEEARQESCRTCRSAQWRRVFGVGAGSTFLLGFDLSVVASAPDAAMEVYGVGSRLT